MLPMNDSWVSRVLQRHGIGSPVAGNLERPELHLRDFFEAAPGYATPSGPARTDGIAGNVGKVCAYLPHDYADTFRWAFGVLVDALDLIYPPWIAPGEPQWPLSAGALIWPYFEWLLHAETDYPGYREHVVHSVRVAALGRWLIAECQWASGGDARGEMAKDVVGTDQVQRLLRQLNLDKSVVTDRIVLAAWWLAALFHDIAYAWFFFGQLEKQIRGALPWYSGDTAAGLVRGCSPDMMERALFRDFLANHAPEPPDWSARRKSWEIGLYHYACGNHSVAGALMLLQSLEAAKDLPGYVDPRYDLVFHLAAEAIFYHDLWPTHRAEGQTVEKVVPVKVRWSGRALPIASPPTVVSPLAALLSLCDGLQSWGRPKLVPRAGPGGNKVLVADTDTSAPELSATNAKDLQVSGDLWSEGEKDGKKWKITIGDLAKRRCLWLPLAIKQSKDP